MRYKVDSDKHQKSLTVRPIILSRMQKNFCCMHSLTHESLKICSHSALDHPLHGWSRNTWRGSMVCATSSTKRPLGSLCSSPVPCGTLTSPVTKLNKNSEWRSTKVRRTQQKTDSSPLPPWASRHSPSLAWLSPDYPEPPSQPSCHGCDGDVKQSKTQSLPYLPWLIGVDSYVHQ